MPGSMNLLAVAVTFNLLLGMERADLYPARRKIAAARFPNRSMPPIPWEGGDDGDSLANHSLPSNQRKAFSWTDGGGT